MPSFANSHNKGDGFTDRDCCDWRTGHDLGKCDGPDSEWRARPTYIPRRAAHPVPCSSPVLLVAAIPRAGAAVSRFAKRPRSGLALTRRTRLRSSCSEEDSSPSLEGCDYAPLDQVSCRSLSGRESHE